MPPPADMDGTPPPRERACVDIMAAAVDPFVIPEAVKPRKLIRLEVRHGVATEEDNITVADFIENCVFGVKYQGVCWKCLFSIVSTSTTVLTGREVCGSLLSGLRRLYMAFHSSPIFWNPPKHVQLSSLTLSCGEVLLAGHSTMVPSPMQ